MYRVARLAQFDDGWGDFADVPDFPPVEFVDPGVSPLDAIPVDHPPVDTWEEHAIERTPPQPDVAERTPPIDGIMPSPTVETLVQRYLDLSGGNLTAAQNLASQWRTGPLENDPVYRDAQHALLTAQFARDYPMLTPIVPLLVVAYSGAKALVQALPEPIGQAIDTWLTSLGADPLARASAPSVSEMVHGVAPLVGRW